jgi:hypothetical protein
MSDNQKSETAQVFFECLNCDFRCLRKNDYNRHILTRKHKKAIINNVLAIKKAQTDYKCENCEKTYKDYSGLWRHKKKCKKPIFFDKSQVEELLSQTSSNKDEIIFQLLKDNQDFKNLIIEQNKAIMEMAKEAKTTKINNDTTSSI